MSNLTRRMPYLRYLLNHIHEQWTKPCKHWNKIKLLSLYIHNSALVFYIMWYIWNKGFWSIWAFIRNLYFSLGRLRFFGTRFPGSLVATLFFLSRFHFVGIFCWYFFSCFNVTMYNFTTFDPILFLKIQRGTFLFGTFSLYFLAKKS